MSRIFDSVLEGNSYLSGDECDNIPIYEGYDAETGGTIACSEAIQDMVSIYEAINALAIADLVMEGTNIEVYKKAWSSNNKEAKKLFNEGIKLFKKHEFDKAKSKFTDAKTLFNKLLSQVKGLSDSSSFSNGLSKAIPTVITIAGILAGLVPPLLPLTIAIATTSALASTPFVTNDMKNVKAYRTLRGFIKKNESVGDMVKEKMKALNEKRAKKEIEDNYNMKTEFNYFKKLADDVLTYNIEYCDTFIELCNDPEVKKLTESMENIELDDFDDDNDDEPIDVEESFTIAEEGVKSAASNVFEKIKNAWQNFLGRLRNFFSNVKSVFDKSHLNNRDFMQKYKASFEKIEKSGSLDGFKMKMYKYPGANEFYADSLFGRVSKHIDNAFNKAKTIDNLQDVEKTKNDIMDNIRADIVGKSVSAEDFKDSVTQKIRGELGEYKLSSTEIFTELDTGANMTTVEKCRQAMESSFKTEMNLLSKASHDTTDTKRAEFEARKASIKLSFFVQGQSIAITAFNIWKQMVAEKDHVFKLYVIEALKYSNKSIKKTDVK